jgi:hypothetical protein
MSATVRVSLPDHVLQRAKLLAQNSGRRVEDVLAQTIELSLEPLGAATKHTRPMVEWSDEDVMRTAESRMDRRDDRRLSRLLDRQQAGLLTKKEKSELAGLMKTYQFQLLQKAQALSEAVRRGLREPLGRDPS